MDDADAAAAIAASSGPTPPPAATAPFHYLINEQAKSIAALQELQNEVSALLEFRDLVMETFPHLRGKDGPATSGGCARWEPGVRVRRKLRGEADASLAAPPPPRSRSNSHGHKSATKAAAGDSGSSTASSAVQDSGFCADSSKGAAAESEDELWTLLELIEVRGTLLRREAEQLREKCEAPRRARSLQDLRPLSDDSFDRGRSATAVVVESATDWNARAAARLGALDGVVSRPSVRMRGAAGVRPDPEKTAAILREASVLELRRHLLTTIFDNQVVRHRLGGLSRAHRELTLQLEKANEDNEDLRFQLEEKSIELEGTRARVRLLERLHAAKLHPAPPSPPPTTSSADARTHAHVDAEQSSTESAHHDDKLVADSPKRRPSRIPLKSYSAPKPPQSTNRMAGKRGTGGNRTAISVPATGIGSASRRSRKSSQDSYTSTNSTPSVRRDPPSSPAPEKIPQRERIVSDSDSKTEFPDSLDRPVQQRQHRSFYDSIETEATADCDSLDDLV